MKGKVKWFQDAKGYGFIDCEDGSSLFAHYSNIVGEGHRTLKEGEPVEFGIEQTPKGPRATQIVKLNGN